MTTGKTPTRRRFMKTAAFAGGSLLLTGTRASGQIDGAGDRLRIAVAGLNGRGQSHLGGWLKGQNVEVAYAIDPDSRALSNTMKSLEK